MESDASPCLYTRKESHWQVNATLDFGASVGKETSKDTTQWRRLVGWLVENWQGKREREREKKEWTTIGWTEDRCRRLSFGKWEVVEVGGWERGKEEGEKRERKRERNSMEGRRKKGREGEEQKMDGMENNNSNNGGDGWFTSWSKARERPSRVMPSSWAYFCCFLLIFLLLFWSFSLTRLLSVCLSP